MKGKTTLKINLATMIEAVQMYLDSQFTGKHTVKDVVSVTGGYASTRDFEIELDEALSGEAQ